MSLESVEQQARTPPPIRPEWLADSVLKSGLLELSAVKEFRSWVQSGSRSAQEIVNELVLRKWLTPFQMKEIVRGRVAGLMVGPFQLIDILGEGGMGRVFRARQTRLGRIVALKILRKEKLDKPQTMARFRQEVRAAATLSHPNVVLALDADETDGFHYFAMEYVDGTDLTKWVHTNGPMPVSLACETIRQASLGLQHAAEQGLVHRDIKPSNILLTKSGQAKILDLGLAMLRESDDDRTRITQAGYVLGTPDFVAPEQAKNSMTVDSRADIYSLAATLYYCLTGRVPYDAATPADKLVCHVTAPPPSLLAVRPDLPESLDHLIQWAMAKSPDERPQTPADFAATLAPYCPSNGSVAEIEPHFALDERRTRPRGPKPSSPIVPAILGLVASLCLGAFGYWAWITFNPAPIVLGNEFTNKIGMTLVKLPSGTFRMGSPADEPERDDHEGPVREVTISNAFYMAKTEVTDQQYRAIMGGSPSRTGNKGRVSDSQPVNSVTFDEAVEFCKKLTDKEKAAIPTGWSYRLPTEAEWEYACRATTVTPYSFGDSVVSLKQGVFAFGAGERPRLAEVVGSTDPNLFGLHDLHGNVWEWVSDHYARDRGSDAVTDPTGPAGGDFRVIKGGAWDTPPAKGRSASRERLMPSARQLNVGFRVILAPSLLVSTQKTH